MTLYKKFFSILCSLFMALGMGTTPILADENGGSSSTTTPTYSITITNAIDGATYTAYKVFDASTNATNSAVSYTISTTSPIYGLISAKDSGFTLENTSDETIKTIVVSKTATELDALQKILVTQLSATGDAAKLSQLPQASAKATSANTVAISLDGKDSNGNDLGEGYYFVKSDSEYTASSVITLTNATPKGEINEKTSASPTSFTKTASTTTANRGDTVSYTISFIAYNYETSGTESSEISEYKVIDNSTGIEINPDSIQVKVQEYPNGSTAALETGTKISSVGSNATVENGKDYSVTDGDAPFSLNLSTKLNSAESSDLKNYEQSLTIQIPWKMKDENNNEVFRYASRTLVTITYDAVLKTSDSLTEGVNTAQGYYYTGTKNEPNEIPSKQEVTVKSYRIRVIKVDENKKPLSGAEFGLVKANNDGTVTKVDGASSISNKYTYIPIYKDLDGNYTVDQSLATKTVTNADGITKQENLSNDDNPADYAVNIETDANGEAVIYGLEDTNVETVNTGSQNGEQSATAKNDYYLVELKAPDGYNLLQEPKEVALDTTANYTVITVTNTKGTLLPNTGGMGTKIFYIVGGLMVAGAVIFLITNRRMKSE
jgi:LPXTG-motif cell wall-anchored protein